MTLKQIENEIFELDQKIKIIEDYEQLIRNLSMLTASWTEDTDIQNELAKDWDKEMEDFRTENKHREKLDMFKMMKNELVNMVINKQFEE